MTCDWPSEEEDKPVLVCEYDDVEVVDVDDVDSTRFSV